MAPVQIKVVYDYYSAKRTTLFFITEEELLNLDFHSFTVNVACVTGVNGDGEGD